LAEARPSFLRRNRWIPWLAGSLLLVLAAAATTVAILAHRIEPFLRDQVVAQLQQHFRARVQLDSFHISISNGLWAEGKGLRIWPPVQADAASTPVPDRPLISLDQFRFHTPLHYRPGQPIHIQVVQLKGLSIDMPPKSHFQSGPAAVPKPASASVVKFSIDKIQCTDANLLLETNKPGKLPLDFAIASLTLTNVTPGGAMNYDAVLTNPRPVGTIHATGAFGPWQVADPGESPTTGDYRFDHADLATFKGIAGIMTSTGHFQGTLRQLEVDGEADVPDFRLTHFGNALPLWTHFHAMVDGTNGDTRLDPVDATLGRSHFTAQGPVVRVISSKNGEPPHSIGHDIALTVQIDHAHIEDFLRLASNSPTQLLTGDVTMQAKLHIPPGPIPVHRRITVAGTFLLNQARFTSDKIQGRIAELSLRGQGHPNELKTADPTTILSTMQGTFLLAAGTVTLPALVYTVPGANIHLSGNYELDDGAINFTGTAKMDASVSQMVGGWKGLLLKPADRYFRKNGAGTEVPIHIDGTREQPRFGIDFDRMKTE